MVTIYQIPLNGGLSPMSVITAKSELMLGFLRWKDEYAKLYVRTYEVDADNLEQAFQSTNLWDDDLVTRFRDGSSMSVGDIAVLDGNCYFCDSYGWVALGKYEDLK